MTTETRGSLEYLTGGVTAIQTRKAPVNRSRTGYGCKIPTTFMLIDTETRRRYRVYVMCYSNSGTSYIITQGRMVIVDCLDTLAPATKQVQP